MIRFPFRRRSSEPDPEPESAPPSTGTSAQPQAVDARWVRELVDAATIQMGRGGIAEPVARALPAVATLLNSRESVRAAALILLVGDRLRPGGGTGTYTLISLLARRRLLLSGADLLDLISRFTAVTRSEEPWQAGYALDAVVPVIERSMTVLPPEQLSETRAALADLLTVFDNRNTLPIKPESIQRLKAKLERVSGVPLDTIKQDDGFGRAARAAIEDSPEPREALGSFVGHLTRATKSGRPSARWFGEAQTLAAPLGDGPALVRSMLQVALDVDDGIVVHEYTGQYGQVQRIERAQFVGPTNEWFLRNCVWAAAAIHDSESIPLLRALAQKCIVVIGGQFGSPRSLAVALACPGAIASIGVPASLTALQGLQRSVRHGSLLREIGKAIDALAAGASISRSELLETAAERHELDPARRREMSVGGWTAVISVEVGGHVVVSWRNPDGRTVASVPKAVRDEQAAAAKAVATAAKSVRETVAAERARLDRLYLEGRHWNLATWRERYLAHPVTGALARGLVWRFQAGERILDGIPTADGSGATNAHGAVFAIPADAEVELWHPIMAREEEVRAWRERLLREHLRQPLKQIFRELYVVTPAELETGTYSNRFARHVIRQAQARALMKGRGWTPVAVGWWDDGIDHGVSRRLIEAHGIRVEFFYDPIIDIQPTASDLIPYCTTDQVRFFATEPDRALDIRDVPALVFTEAMRDVDLFVGVTTIGADPQWLDRGERRFDTYWHDWAFGDLGQPAKVRREVIASLLPALKIADRCTLTDRYLEVRGDIRTYKIHLGSSNILMGPADRYLCIVATRHPAEDRLFLPFDDDPVLSLILSKAFLLADDTAIKDSSILRQINSQ